MEQKLKRPKTALSASNKNDVESIKTSFINILEQVIAKDEYTATDNDLFKALAYMARAKMMKKWIKTQQKYHFKNSKRVYYLSLEFLIGRLLEDSILNLGIEDNTKEALKSMNIDYAKIAESEPDAGLGNGGLGRLAACFMDSMATLGIPCHGYGIRYNYGIFRQEIQNGWQTERPDDWLKSGNPWEIERYQYAVRVKFFGKVKRFNDPSGKLCIQWTDTQDVVAMPYDIPVPGYGNETVNTLRLWASRAVEEFNLGSFNEGDYIKSCENMIYSENISKILYPNDNMSSGKELRFKQQYFFVAASIQDIIRRFKVHNNDFSLLPDKVVIQLNDTHPTLAIPELMRVLLDEENVPWEKAWEITQKTFAYSNHTLLPEALEKWSVEMFTNILPRHMEIIFEINHRFLEDIRRRFPGEEAFAQRVSIIEECEPKMVRMAYLATLTCFSVNGVSALHSELLKSQLLRDFYRLFPDKFNNKTNGITQRRWLFNINAPLSLLLERTIGDSWIRNLGDMRKIIPYTKDKNFIKSWQEAKFKNKEKLAKTIYDEHGVQVSPEALFDIQAERIHEYKRQLLCIMHTIHLYNEIRKNPKAKVTPRVVLIAGKSAPGYRMAKLLIKFTNAVADRINNEPACQEKLNLFFVKDYSVSLASKLMPACDLSEQISTAGYEASGTGNMKFALNGALTIGTLDGANTEIMEEVGKDNIFIFGHTVEEVQELRARGYDPKSYYENDEKLRAVIDLIRDNHFAPEEPDLFRPIYDTLMNGDTYMHMADFRAYIEAQSRVSALYNDKDAWAVKSILNVANMEKFSSDRTIADYANEIWNVPHKGE